MAFNRTISPLVTNNCTPGCTSRDAALAVVTATQARVCSLETDAESLRGVRREVSATFDLPNITSHVLGGGNSYFVANIKQPPNSVIFAAYAVVTETVNASGAVSLSTLVGRNADASVDNVATAINNIMSGGMVRPAGYSTLQSLTNGNLFQTSSNVLGTNVFSANNFYTATGQDLFVFIQTSDPTVTFTSGKIVFVIEFRPVPPTGPAA
jgi:hypothetical protein